MRRWLRREEIQESQGLRVPRSKGPMDQVISKSHSNTSLTLKKVHLVVFSGGRDQDAGVYSDKILLFDPDTKTFNNIGKLEQRRAYHSVSVVDINDFICS